MNDLPATPPLPSPGVTPPPVSRVEELLSAMVDDELTSDELAELDAAAATRNSEPQELAAPFHAAQARTAETVLDLRPAKTLRHQQLTNALAQLDQPEVASLGAARVTLAEKQHHQRRRLQRLSSVAAALVVVAGIGILGSQLGGSDNETASFDEDGASTLSRELNDDFAGGAATDDSASGDGAMATAESLQNRAGETSLDAPDGAFGYMLQEGPIDLLPSELGNAAGDGLIDIQPFDAGSAQNDADPAAGTEAEEDAGNDLGVTNGSAQCVDAAIAVQNNEDILEISGVALVRIDGQVYEIYQNSDDDFAVFEQATCSRVD